MGKKKMEPVKKGMVINPLKTPPKKKINK